MVGGGDVSLSDAPIFRIELLFFAILIITLLWEKGTHALDKWLSKDYRQGLKKAIHNIQDEILLLGLISLILIVFEVHSLFLIIIYHFNFKCYQEYILKICVKKQDDHKEYEENGEYEDHKHLLLRK